MSTDLEQQLKAFRVEMLERFNITDRKLRGVHRHLGSLQSYIAETLDINACAVDGVITDHESRITDLEAELPSNTYDPVTVRFHNIMKQPERVH